MGPRKDKQGASSSRGKRIRNEDPPAYNTHLFRDADRAKRYDDIQNWTLIPERRVSLQEDEYPAFYQEVLRRGWRRLAEPLPAFDPEIVLEFYANAWHMDGEPLARKTYVRGVTIHFDKNSLNEFLDHPLDSTTACDYQRFKRRGYENQEVAATVCAPGRSFETNSAGMPLRILRGNMTTLSQIWASFLLANVTPNRHSSDLILDKCLLIHCLIHRLPSGAHHPVDIARIISDEIWEHALQERGRNPNRPKALGFPALITAFCAYHGVEVAPSAAIRPPIDRRFILRHCRNPLEEVEQQQQPQQHPHQGRNHVRSSED